MLTLADWHVKGFGTSLDALIEQASDYALRCSRRIPQTHDPSSMSRERSQSGPASSSIHHTGVQHRITTASPATTMHRRSQAQNLIECPHSGDTPATTPPITAHSPLHSNRHATSTSGIFPRFLRPTVGLCVAMAAHQWNRQFASGWPIGWVVHYMSDVGRIDLPCPSSLRCVLEFFAGV